MKYRIFKTFKYIFMLLIISIIVFNIIVSVTNVNADSDSTFETVYYEGYWGETWDDELHQLTRLPSQSNDIPSVTILVHGQGGDASHWSNDSNGEFVYDSTSLIEKLRLIAGDANVYLAKFTSASMGNLLIEKCEIVNNQYKKSSISKIEDASKHTIVVIESQFANSYHRDVYNELHKIVDLVSYDILYLTGKVPKVNFISHSRGGLISMMYATGYKKNSKLANVKYIKDSDGNYIEDQNYPYTPNGGEIVYDHPYNVCELYSMGTPYLGTNFANRLTETLMYDLFDCFSAQNILDETIQNEIYTLWEETIIINPQIKLHAIAGTFSLSFLIGLLCEDYESLNNENYLSAKKVNLILTLLDEWGRIGVGFLTAIEANILNGAPIIFIDPILGTVLSLPIGVVLPSVTSLRNCLAVANLSIQNFESKYRISLLNQINLDQLAYAELAYVINDFISAFRMFEELIANFDENYNFLANFGDLFIDTNSQHAKNFSNVIRYERVFKYKNIQFSYNENFEFEFTYDDDSDNFEFKKATEMPGIPHILETRDKKIIEYICGKIELAKPSSIYEFEKLNDNTLSIKDINIPNYYSESYEKFLYSAMEFKNISSIGANSFAEASYLTSFIIPDTVIEIEDNAFSDCINLESITLPKHLVEIGDKAFKGCTSLSSVTLLKDCYDVPILGANVFEECASNLQIHVPKNKYIDYCIGPNWEDYEQKIVIDDILDSLSLNCVSYGNLTLELDKGYNKLYKLNIECSKSYKFTTDSNIIFKIYKSNKDVLYIGNQNLSGFLSVGEYYLDIRYNSNNLNGSFEAHYELTYLSSNIDVNINNITNFTSNLHLSYDNKKHSVLRFDNNQGEGFYIFKLNAGNISLYPSGAIKIYKDQARTILHDRFDTDMLSYSAISKINENEMYVYLENNETYYIDILINNIEYSSVNFEIKKVEESNIDYINSFINMGFNSIFENVNKYSYFEKVIIKQKSKVQIDVIASGLLNSCVPILIFKEEMDLGSSVNNRDYYLETILIGETTPINTMPAFGSILEPGTYYIGYIENQEKAFMSVAITRIVEYDDNMGNVLVADPYHVGYDLGTEVLYNYGECNNYTITEGFTRNIYLMVEDRFTDPMSRLYYDWYSSNESAAIVTNFGTVLAMPVNEDTAVTIYAALKTDPSIVYYRTFTILNDEEDLIEIDIECDMSYSYSEENGTYQLELNNTNCPYPMIQYYNWMIVNHTNVNVSINNWGNVSSNGPTEVLVVGTYILNPKVRIYIHLLITE